MIITDKLLLLAETGGGISREEFIDSLAQDILDKMPEVHDLREVRKIYRHEMNPTKIVLLQELERFNSLIATMRRTLILLKRALAGEIGMDATLDNVAWSLFNGQLPDSWRKRCPQTCKALGGWMDHFERREEQYFNWVRA